MSFMESSTENRGQTLKLPFQSSLQMADHGEPDISVFEQLAARQSINQGNWSIQHQPGNKMTADIGTKPLSSERIKVLREEMNMFEVPSTEKEEEEKNVDESVPRLREGAGADLEKAAVASRLREGAGADLEKAAVASRLREGAGADLEKAAVASRLREGAGADLEKAAVALRLREGAGADLEKAAVALKLLTVAAVLSSSERRRRGGIRSRWNDGIQHDDGRIHRDGDRGYVGDSMLVEGLDREAENQSAKSGWIGQSRPCCRKKRKRKRW